MPRPRTPRSTVTPLHPAALPPGVTAYRDRHGRTRFRYRVTGFKPHHFRSTDSAAPAFFAEYGAHCGQPVTQKASAVIPGTFDDLAERFYASTAWANLKPITRSTYRNIIERFRADHGGRRVAKVRFEHLDAIIAAVAAERGHGAASNLRKTLKRLLGFAVKLRMIDRNPADHTEPVRASVDGDGEGGFHCWTEEEIAAFRARWPSGTKPRRAMELLLWTALRRQDVVRMGWQNVVEMITEKGREPFLRVRQSKTGKPLLLLLAPQLRRELDHVPAGQMIFLMTEEGKAFTAAGFGNWFRARCDEAGLKGCTAHGLRKAITRRAADLLATQQQLKSVGGWSTDSMVRTYTAQANQRHLAEATLRTVSAWDFGEPSQGSPNIATLND